MGTSQPRLLVALVITISLVTLLPSCKGTTTPDPPPVEKVKILTTVTATYVFNGSPATGTVTFQPASGTVVSGTLGVQTDLGEIAKDTSKNFTITIEAGGALKRVFKVVALRGTQSLSTTVLELAGFDLEGYTSYFLNDLGNAGTGWINGIWDQPNITVYFNPDPLTGLRLTQDFITATENAVNEIKGYSHGFIQSVTNAGDGDKPIGVSPPDGECWVYRWTEANGVHNISYPTNSPVVKSLKLLYNLSSSTPSQIRKEVMDAFIQGNQNVFLDDYLAKWFEFSLYWRPKGNANSYRIFLDHEEQVGIDSLSTLQTLGEVPVTAPSSLHGTDLQAPPARAGIARPATKERIRN